MSSNLKELLWIAGGMGPVFLVALWIGYAPTDPSARGFAVLSIGSHAFRVRRWLTAFALLSGGTLVSLLGLALTEPETTSIPVLLALTPVVAAAGTFAIRNMVVQQSRIRSAAGRMHAAQQVGNTTTLSAARRDYLRAAFLPQPVLLALVFGVFSWTAFQIRQTIIGSMLGAAALGLLAYAITRIVRKRADA